jgi:hypothetical protein
MSRDKLLAIPAELGLTRGDLVTTRGRLESSLKRKVYLVLSGSRSPFRVRVCSWSQSSKTWSCSTVMEAAELVPAPTDWPQTKAARTWLAKSSRGIPF